MVKVIASSDITEFENKLNDFICDRDIVVKDIKFAIEGYSQMETKYAALVIYKDAH